MSSKTEDPKTTQNSEPAGGRTGGPLDGATSVVGAPKGLGLDGPASDPKNDKDKNAAFGLDQTDKDVKGSLKIHIKLDLEADIRIIARIKGDIAIGLL